MRRTKGCELTERVAEVMANDSGLAVRNNLMSVPVPNKLLYTGWEPTVPSLGFEIRVSLAPLDATPLASTTPDDQ